MNQEFIVTRAQLVDAFTAREQDHRDGKLATYEEVAAMSVEDAAEATVDTLLTYLRTEVV